MGYVCHVTIHQLQLVSMKSGGTTYNTSREPQEATGQAWTVGPEKAVFCGNYHWFRHINRQRTLTHLNISRICLFSVLPFPIRNWGDPSEVFRPSPSHQLQLRLVICHNHCFVHQQSRVLENFQILGKGLSRLSCCCQACCLSSNSTNKSSQLDDVATCLRCEFPTWRQSSYWNIPLETSFGLIYCRVLGQHQSNKS